MTGSIRGPTPALAGAAVVAGLVATGVAASAAQELVGYALLAVGAVLVGILADRRLLVDVGAVALFATVMAGGVIADPVFLPAVGAVASVVCWDCAHGSIDLGRHLGRAGRTHRLEATLATTSIAIGIATLGLVTATYWLIDVGVSMTGVVLLVLAATFALLAIGGWYRNPGAEPTA